MDYVYAHRSQFESLPDKPFLSLSSAFQIPNSAIDREAQNKILCYFRSDAYRIEKNNPLNSSYSFWDPLSIRALDPGSVPAPYLNQRISQVEYLFRHHPESKWLWRDHPLTELVQSFVQPYLPLFQFLTRIKIHIQQPQSTVRFHRDLTAGQSYEIFHPLSTDHCKGRVHVYQMYPWVDLSDLPKYESLHQIQNCFSLKIPLSENPHAYGLQKILDEKPYYYTTSGNSYFLNESSYHGAGPVSFARGLIFVDGVLNPQAIESLSFAPVSCRPYDYLDFQTKTP